MHWYAITFGPDEVQNGWSVKFLRDFVQCMTNSTYDHGLALFRRQLEAGLGESIYYLPPSANKLCASLLEDYKGSITEKPDPRSLEVAIGPKESLDYWYRKRESAKS